MTRRKKAGTHDRNCPRTDDRNQRGTTWKDHPGAGSNIQEWPTRIRLQESAVQKITGRKPPETIQK